MRDHARFVLRNATACVLTGALASTASAAPKEIPPGLMDYAARARARLAPSERARVDALVPRISPKMSVQEVKTLAGAGGAASSDLIMACLMDYLKDVLNEVRENHKIERFESRLALAQKAGKLDLERAKIEAMKREAEERFDHAMDAAYKEMAMGMASAGAAALSAAGGAASSGPATSRAPVNARLAVTPPVVRVVPVPTKTPTKAK